MILIDTSIWINLLGKRKSPSYKTRLQSLIGGHDVVLTRFQQLEILQGCRHEKEWLTLSEYLNGQDYLEMDAATWQSAARLFYSLRKKGLTIRSPIDCCIAQIAIEQRVVLIHDDRDFEVIGRNFPLQQQRFTCD